MLGSVPSSACEVAGAPAGSPGYTVGTLWAQRNPCRRCPVLQRCLSTAPGLGCCCWAGPSPVGQEALGAKLWCVTSTGEAGRCHSHILVLAGTGSCCGWPWCHSWGQLELQTPVGWWARGSVVGAGSGADWSSAGLGWELLQRGVGSALAPCSISRGRWERWDTPRLCPSACCKHGGVLGVRVLGELWQQQGRRRMWSHF